MPKSIPQHRWEPSAEVRAVAKTRLPLKLPRPEETGPHRLPLGDQSTRPVKPSRPMRRTTPRSFESLSDVELEAMAQRTLLQTGIKGFAMLHVEVRDRQVTLFGSLPTEFERQLASQLVRRVNGVESVADEIAVRERGMEMTASPHAIKSHPLGGFYLLAGISVIAACLISAVWIAR